MITIKNKKEAISLMKNLGLNYFPVDVFNPKDLDEIENFFNTNKAEEYILRSPTKTNAKFYFVKNFEEAKSVLSKFKKEVTIDVSFRPYKDDLVLLGDIIIHKNSNTVDLTARSDSEASHRNIYEKPEYNLHSSLDDDKVWSIRGFDKIAKYISDYELYDVIVEFVVYSIKVGVKKNNVVISEIRTAF